MHHQSFPVMRLPANWTVCFLFSLFCTDTFAQDQSADELPLPFQPTYTNESELGLTEARGNTQNMTFFGKHKSSAEFQKNTFTLRGQYFYGKANNELNLRNWMSRFRWDRTLAQKWDTVFSQTLEGNRFMGFDFRSNTDLGAAYFIIPKKDKGDRNFLRTELGYRLQYEERIVNDEFSSTSHQGRVFLENSKEFGKSFFTLASVEWAKTFGNDNRNLVTLEVSANSKVNSILSLKTSYTVRYDDSLKSRGFEYTNDRILTVSLVANY